MEHEPVVLVDSAHVGVLEGAKEVGWQGEQFAKGLVCGSMSRWQARGVEAILWPAKDWFMVHWGGVPGVPRRLHVITHGA